jgi:Bacterial protein of unknown function (DUF922)
MLRRLALCVFVLASSLRAQDTTVSQPAGPKRPEGRPSKTWEKSLVQALKPTPAGVKYQLNVTETPIDAESMRDVVVKLNEESKRMMEIKSARSPGSYRWSIDTPWMMEQHLGRCQFKDIDVRLTYDIDVVTLAGPIAQDVTAMASWARRDDALYANHFERLRVMRDAARTLYQKLRNLSNSSCSELANIANQTSREARFALNDEMGRLGGRVAPISDR